MFRWKHRCSRAALRCAFALIGLIFLTVQLSGKFYVWSSQVVFSRTSQSIRPGIHATDHRILSLDKRYKAQKKYSLLIQPVQREFITVTAAATGCLSQPVTLAEDQRSPSGLRGPPIAG